MSIFETAPFLKIIAFGGLAEIKLS